MANEGMGVGWTSLEASLDPGGGKNQECKEFTKRMACAKELSKGRTAL